MRRPSVVIVCKAARVIVARNKRDHSAPPPLFWPGGPDIFSVQARVSSSTVILLGLVTAKLFCLGPRFSRNSSMARYIVGPSVFFLPPLPNSIILPQSRLCKEKSNQFLKISSEAGKYDSFKFKLKKKKIKKEKKNPMTRI